MKKLYPGTNSWHSGKAISSKIGKWSAQLTRFVKLESSFTSDIHNICKSRRNSKRKRVKQKCYKYANNCNYQHKIDVLPIVF